MSTRGSFEQTEGCPCGKICKRKKVCVAGEIPKFQKKIILIFGVRACA